MKTLGGAIFIRNNNKYDYHILESIDCLMKMCDQVVILDAGSDDGTLSMILTHLEVNYRGYALSTGDTDSLEMHEGLPIVVVMTPYQWDSQQGHQKLSYFQNIAIQHLDTDYVFLLQGDEAVHENSFPWIRQAIEEGNESYLCHRINLWGSPDHYLDVTQDRKPCSDVVLRLAKRGHLSYGDGESIECYPTSDRYVMDIEIWHTGFVRSRKVMVDKIINMQRDVFQTTPDRKLEGMISFDPFAWFLKEDLKPIEKSHPTFITNWINERRGEYAELW